MLIISISTSFYSRARWDFRGIPCVVGEKADAPVIHYGVRRVGSADVEEKVSTFLEGYSVRNIYCLKFALRAVILIQQGLCVYVCVKMLK